MRMMPQNRLARLQFRLRESGVDLAAVGSPANLRYLLGFAPHLDERLWLLLVGADAVRIVVPDLNRSDVMAHTDIELLSWSDVDGPETALHQALEPWSTSRSIAVDGAMRADALLHLRSNFYFQTFIVLDPVIAPLRERKTPEEVEVLARAAAQADRAMQAAVDRCRAGVTEAQVAWAAEAVFRQDGAEMVDFTLIGSGPNGAHPHHHGGDRQLQEGDAVVIDIGATLEGYKSDITRMVYLGQPSGEFLSAYQAVLTANERARAAVQPGRTAEEIDRIARSSLDAAGYGPFFTHRLGHGIGLDGHEPPWIKDGDTTVLEEGMAFSIEPGVYFDGKFGIRIEDIVVVTADGVRGLTGFDHGLIIK